RYLLGNLQDFDPEVDAVPYEQMHELDRWVLNRLQDLTSRLLAAYERFEFHVVYHNLHNFCVLDLSSFYLDIIKDRLYTSPRNSLPRRSAQTAMNEVLETLVRLMAPVLSFTADEIWQHMKGKDRQESVHLECFLPVNEQYRDPELAARWEAIISVRREVTKALEQARKNKEIGHSLDASVELGLSDELMTKLAPYKDELRTIFIVSSVRLMPSEELKQGQDSDSVPGLRINVSASKDPKCERCWVHDPSIGQNKEHPTLCQRCVSALEQIGE
ncbi:MAG: isoleucine--tRNA ligase, partial [Deltaproteobacteria bacterium]